MCTGGSQKCIDGSHGVKYSDDIQETEDIAYWMEQEQKILNMNIRKES